MSAENIFLEVIAATVEDAREAEAGGAARLEIVRDLDQGGLTPALDIVRAITRAVSLPVRVMVRETPTYTVASAEEMDRLCAAARAFAELGIEGLVLGFLREGDVDVESTARVLACAPGVKATFHRAFEAAHDAARAMDALRRMPQIDRILAGGGEGSPLERRAHLEALARLAQPEITVLAGGNVTPEALCVLCPSPLLQEFHLGRAAREPETPLAPVRAEKVRQVIAQMRQARRE